MDSPNPVMVTFSILKSLLTVSRPVFGSGAGPSHDRLAGVLASVTAHGMTALPASVRELDSYIDEMGAVRASSLTRDASLAFWLNIYNAGALRLAATASAEGAPSVLRVPGGFSKPLVAVEGESLSMDAIEHAKIRRFKDPRIHGALVCGSVSCPTLRRSPYEARALAAQLDEQMQAFLAGGGAVFDSERRVLELSRVFLWYGGDFAWRRRMPTFLPATRRRLVAALRPWLPPGVPSDVAVEFQSYDWGLRCAVG